MSFLCTRVTAPDVDDWKKLGHCLQYLNETKGTNSHVVLHRSIHNLLVGRCLIWGPRGLSQSYGAVMMMNHRAMFALSSKQKLNTRSSTEAELVGVNDAMTMILWTKHFLEAQGYPVQENIIYQDNESSMKLEKYGR